MNKTLTAWIAGVVVFGLFWLAAYPTQRSARLRPDAAPIPKALAWVSGFPHTPTVEPGSFGFQFYAVSLVVANTVLVLFGRQEDRVAWLSLALMLNSLLVLLVTEWLRRRRRRESGGKARYFTLRANLTRCGCRKV